MMTSMAKFFIILVGGSVLIGAALGAGCQFACSTYDVKVKVEKKVSAFQRADKFEAEPQTVEVYSANGTKL